MPASNRVTLKHHLVTRKKKKSPKVNLNFLQPIQLVVGSYRLPQISQPKPQNTAPTSKPAFAAKLKNGALKVNSSMTGARIRPVINYFGKTRKKKRRSGGSFSLVT